MSFSIRKFFSNTIENTNDQVNLSFLQTDMHSHLIPGIDDGSEDMEESITMIKGLMELGYKKIITTPHIFPGVYFNSPENITEGLKKLNAHLKEQNIDITIEAAAEYMVDGDFMENIHSDKPLLCFSDRYILIEQPFVSESPFLKQAIFSLKVAGMQPVLAHVERFPYLFNNGLKEAEELCNRGCLLQGNILSLANYYGKECKKQLKELLKKNMIAFIGTDMHHTRHLSALKALLKDREMVELLQRQSFLNEKL